MDANKQDSSSPGLRGGAGLQRARSGPPWVAWLGLLAPRLLGLIALVVAAAWLSSVLQDKLNAHLSPEAEKIMLGAIVLCMLAYVALLALPFVPGVEIGIALLTAFGAQIAPWVYLATLTALMLAYGFGRALPPSAMESLLRWARLTRAADLVAQTAPLPPDARLQALWATAPPGAVTWALRHRFLALIVLLNLPGNALVGGGGGIAMVAGLSRLFAPVPFCVAVALAVAPVPLAVWLTAT